MAGRSYAQSCSVAIFLDELGGRWSLLLVRELVLGPRRFSQLLDDLRGIGPNLLAERLAQLQKLEIVKKAHADDGAKSGMYILTEKGRELEPILLGMARWSLKNIPQDDVERRRRDELLVIAFRACFLPDPNNQLVEEFEFRIGDANFVLFIDGQKLTSRLGQSSDPAFVFIASSDTFDQIFKGDVDIVQMEKTGAVKIVGDRSAYDRWQGMFTLDPTRFELREDCETR